LPSATLSSQRQSALLLLAGILLGLENLYLSQSFDAYGLILRGEVTGWRAFFGQFGNLAKLVLVILFAFCLLLQHKFHEYWPQLLNNISQRRFLLILPFQLLAYGACYVLAQVIYADPAAAQTLPGVYYLLWVLSILLTLSTWMFMILDPRWLWNFIKTERLSLALGTGVGLGVWGLAQWTQQFWGPLSDATFSLTASLLQLTHGEVVTVDSAAKVLGIGDFLVNIAPACSGYEGIGLITAFTLIYVWVHRQTLKFPRALLLFPLGALAIWLLNVVRIAVLVTLGHHWSAEVAVGGFHSQAGWITFILTSLALLWLAGNSRYFSRGPAAEVPATPSSDLAVATLIPMIVLLAVTLLSSAFTADFDWLYPVRVFAVLVALVYVWPKLKPVPWRCTWLVPAAGLLVAALWVLLLGTNPEANAVIQENLEQASGWAAALWLLFRFAGTAITVPIAEELAFRAYLLCRFSKAEVTLDGQVPFSLMAVFFSSLAFGALHGAWLAGTVAGIVYALVRLRSRSVTEAIYAHGITNGLLFLYASATGEWHLL
jgi:exosortase E/protease (VPEID-CTERM system)